MSRALKAAYLVCLNEFLFNFILPLLLPFFCSRFANSRYDALCLWLCPPSHSNQMSTCPFSGCWMSLRAQWPVCPRETLLGARRQVARANALDRLGEAERETGSDNQHQTVPAWGGSFPRSSFSGGTRETTGEIPGRKKTKASTVSKAAKAPSHALASDQSHV